MKKSWLVAGVLISGAMGVSISACGSSTTAGTGASGSGASTGTHASSSGTPTSSSNGSGTGGTVAGNSSSAGTGGSVASGSSSSGNCEAPSTLHPPKAVDAGFPGVYCPFSAQGDAGNDYCQGGAVQECCETSADAGMPSQCLAVGSTSCPSGSTIWQCDDPSECPSSAPVCCGVPYTGDTVTIKETAGCTDHYASEMGGTQCVASAAACTGGVIMCTSDAQCTSPQTCLPFRKAGNSVGACQ